MFIHIHSHHPETDCRCRFPSFKLTPYARHPRTSVNPLPHSHLTKKNTLRYRSMNLCRCSGLYSLLRGSQVRYKGSDGISGITGRSSAGFRSITEGLRRVCRGSTGSQVLYHLDPLQSSATLCNISETRRKSFETV